MEAGTRIPQRNATIVIKPAANRLESDPDRMKHLPIGAVESCPLGITGGTARKPLYADNSRHTSVGLDSLWTSYPQLGSSVKRSIVNGFVYVTKRACPVAESTEHSSFVNVTVVLNSRKSRSRPVSTHFMPHRLNTH